MGFPIPWAVFQIPNPRIQDSISTNFQDSVKMLFVIFTCRQQHHLIELLAKLECKAPFRGPSSTPGSPRLSPLKATVPFTSVETSTTSEVEHSKVLSMHTSYSGHCNCLKGSLANQGFINQQRKFGSIKVSEKLPTYPSPNPTFCPKWEVSVNVDLGEG